MSLVSLVREENLGILSNIVRKAKGDVDFCKEYAEKEKLLEERKKTLDSKEEQYMKEHPALFEQMVNNTN